MKNAFWGCLTLKIMFWKINFRRNLVLRKMTIFTVPETQIHNPKRMGTKFAAQIGHQPSTARTINFT